MSFWNDPDFAAKSTSMISPRTEREMDRHLEQLAEFYEPNKLTYPNWSADLATIQDKLMRGLACSLNNNIQSQLRGISYREKLHRKDMTDRRVKLLLQFQENPQNIYFSYPNYRQDLNSAEENLRNGHEASFDGVIEHMVLREKMCQKMRPVLNPARKQAFLSGLGVGKALIPAATPLVGFWRHPLTDKNLIHVIFQFL